jgi:hypothetical protein
MSNLILAGFIKLRHYIATVVGLMVLEALGLYVFRHSILAGWELVYFFYFLLYGVFPIAMFDWRIRTAVSLKRLWTLMLVGVLMNFVALMWRGAIYYNILTHSSTHTLGTNYTDLLIVLSMAPNLIVLSQPNGRPHSRLFFWIDSMQIVVLASLANGLQGAYGTDGRIEAPGRGAACFSKPCCAAATRIPATSSRTLVPGTVSSDQLHNQLSTLCRGCPNYFSLIFHR